MGAAASVPSEPLESWSPEKVASLVSSMGTAYEEYGAIFTSECINGVFLAKLSGDAELKETLSDLGITKGIHVKNLCAQFESLKNAAAGGNHGHVNVNSSSSGGIVSNVAGILEKVATVVHGLDLPTRVSVTPRKLMSDLFAIQGIALDPSDLDPAIDKIIATVGSSGGVCDGDKSFDVFVNYRVAADADVAEKLYLYLKTKGINAFLDKKCLKAGEPWKEGFLSGLSRSRMFICLISSPALANVRDKTKNHEGDNVLLEYETALLIQRHLAEVDVDLARNYIVPVHVGQFSQGVLTKFTDFNPMMYPDSVGPESNHGDSNVDTSSTATPTAAVMDLTTCEGAFAALQLPSLGPADAEAALKAIGNLCRDDESIVKLGESGACEVTVKVLLVYATTNAFVAAQGCYAVWTLASGDVKRGDFADSLVAAGAVDAVIKSLRSFPANTQVVEHGGKAILNLSAGSSDRKDMLMAAGAIEEVIKSLKAFPDNAEIVRLGCKVLYILSGSDDVNNKLVAAGAINEVIKALRIFPENTEVVLQGIKLISSFALTDNDVRDELVAGGAIDEVIKALRAFPENVEVVEWGFKVIDLLSIGSDDRKNKLVAVGAIEEVVKALRAFLDNVEIVRRGCMVIGSLSGGDRFDKLAKAGAIEEVIKAMRTFPDNAEIVEQACMAVYFLSGSIDRNAILLAAGVKPLIEAALNNDTLTQKARDEAKDALDKLD